MADQEESSPAQSTWGQPSWGASTPPPPAPAPPPPLTPPGPDPFGGRAPWEQAAAFTAPSAAVLYATAPLYDLRPLSTGEILDRTFSLYRKRFWLFAGLAVVASTLLTLSTFVQLTWGTAHHPPATTGAGVNPFAAFQTQEFAVSMVTIVITGFIYWFVYSLTQAATVYAVSEIYLGRETTIKASFESVRARWFRYAMIAFWQGWSLLWLPLMLLSAAGVMAALYMKTKGDLLIVAGLICYLGALLGFLYGYYAWMRNSLGLWRRWLKI